MCNNWFKRTQNRIVKRSNRSKCPNDQVQRSLRQESLEGRALMAVLSGSDPETYNDLSSDQRSVRIISATPTRDFPSVGIDWDW